jgi:hypothetical protein
MMDSDQLAELSMAAGWRWVDGRNRLDALTAAGSGFAEMLDEAASRPTMTMSDQGLGPNGVKLMGFVVGTIMVIAVFMILAGVVVLAMQCMFWLKFGYWEEQFFPLYDLYGSTGWLGVDKLITQTPLWVVLLVPGFVAMALGGLWVAGAENRK